MVLLIFCRILALVVVCDIGYGFLRVVDILSYTYILHTYSIHACVYILVSVAFRAFFLYFLIGLMVFSELVIYAVTSMPGMDPITHACQEGHPKRPYPMINGG